MSFDQPGWCSGLDNGTFPNCSRNAAKDSCRKSSLMAAASSKQAPTQLALSSDHAGHLCARHLLSLAYSPPQRELMYWGEKMSVAALRPAVAASTCLEKANTTLWGVQAEQTHQDPGSSGSCCSSAVAEGLSSTFPAP